MFKRMLCMAVPPVHSALWWCNRQVHSIYNGIYHARQSDPLLWVVLNPVQWVAFQVSLQLARTANRLARRCESIPGMPESVKDRYDAGRPYRLPV